MTAVPAVAAGALTFCTSALVLVLEILAGRLLAPYVGISLETSTGIIGTVLAAISLGSWLGGRAADRRDPHRLLGPLLIAGGGASLLTVPIVRLLGPSSLDASAASIVVLCGTAFFLPASLLSAVHPSIVKLRLNNLGETGGTVGGLSAVSTAGALFGTFVTGFLLVATVPVRALILSIGIATIVLGVVLTFVLDRGRRRTGVAVAAATGVARRRGTHRSGVRTLPRRQRVLVRPRRTRSARASGRVLRLDTLRHSYVDLADPTHLESAYTRAFAAVIDTIRPGSPVTALHIGGGGFTMPRWLRATRPGSQSVVLEIDPALVRLARSQLGLRTGPDLRVIADDARVSLRSEPLATFDVVLGDAFSGLSVPWHLTTRELVEEVKERLRPGAVYAVNVIDYPPLGFAKAEAATLASVFANVGMLARPGSGGGNHVLIASDGPIPSVSTDAMKLVEGDELKRFIGGAEVLTDDHAPVDQLLTKA